MIKRLQQRIRKKKNNDWILGIASLLFMLILILINQIKSIFSK